MGVIVNGRFLSRRVTGVDRFAREVLQRLGRRVTVRGGAPRSGIAGHLWEQTALAASVGRDEILWSPANTGPAFLRTQVLTVHDLSPLEHPEWFASRFALWYRLLWSVLIPRVRRILVPSQFVKERLTANFGPRPITVIPEGVDRAFFRPDAPGGTLQLPEKYMLFVGSLSPRKNVTGLLQAWRRISSEFPDIWLVMAGSGGANFPALLHGAESERVEFCGYVPEADLPGLYAGAMLLVLPSLQEGFGLPILEAMACGTPVLASDGGALPETMGNAGMIFALSDPGGLTDAMTILLRNPDLRAELRRAGQEHASKHSWEITAELVWREIHGL